MMNLRKTFAIALTTATLGLGALAASPASAHFERGGFGHHGGGFHPGFGHFGHGRIGWGNGWRRFGWGRDHHCFYHWGCRWGGEHRWGYHWGGYRRVVEVGVAVAPVVVEPSVCPPGTHLGYNHKYCWPNRQ